jgi:hypothetical protein
VLLSSLSGMTHRGFPLSGARSGSPDLTRGVGPRSARTDMPGVSDVCAIAVAASGAATRTVATNLERAEREVISQLTHYVATKMGRHGRPHFPARDRPRETPSAPRRQHRATAPFPSLSSPLLAGAGGNTRCSSAGLMIQSPLRSLLAAMIR